jgi:hypothetical protein
LELGEEGEEGLSALLVATSKAVPVGMAVVVDIAQAQVASPVGATVLIPLAPRQVGVVVPSVSK